MASLPDRTKVTLYFLLAKLFPIMIYHLGFFTLILFASRKKNRERNGRIDSSNEGVNSEEEDLGTNTGDESESEGKKNEVAVYIKDDFIHSF